VTQHLTGSAPAGPPHVGGRPARPPAAELAIPFAHLASGGDPQVEELAEVLLDDAVSAPSTQPSPAPAPAAAAGPPAERAPAGRVLVAVLPLAGDDGGAEILATRLCLALACHVPPDVTALLAAHASPDDVAHWALVDAARAALVEPLDLTVCGHETAVPTYRHLLVVEAPAGHAEAVLAALGAAPFGAAAVLTEAGWSPAGRSDGSGPHAGTDAGTDAVTEAVRVAVVGQAHRTAGRALVFPGQRALAGDLPLADVLARTAIGAVGGPAGDAPHGALVRCHGYARPRHRDGVLALPVAHDGADVVTAIEVRYSRPCCGEAH